MVDKAKTMMVLSCHPADAFDLAGGTIANHIKSGYRVIVVNITHGGLSHGAMMLDHMDAQDSDEIKLKKIIKIKQQEALNAARALGVTDCVDLGYEDEPFILTRQMIHDLAEMIRKEKPWIVLSHHPNEFSHEDHSVAGELTVKALTAAARWVLNSKYEAHYVPAVYFYGVQSRPKQFKMAVLPLAPDIIIDIEDVIEQKVQAFCELKSQKNTPEVVWNRVKSMEAEAGRLYGFKFAEQFISFYPLKDTLLPDNLDISFYSLLENRYQNSTENKDQPK